MPYRPARLRHRITLLEEAQVPTAPCKRLEPVLPVFGSRNAGQCDDRQESGRYCRTIETGGGNQRRFLSIAAGR